MGHKDSRLGKIVYILVFYNISFFWLLPLNGFQFIFLLRDSENDLYVYVFFINNGGLYIHGHERVLDLFLRPRWVI